MQRLATIRRTGAYKIRLVWECEWYGYLRRNPRTARAYRELALPSSPMQLRPDAYFGGRVETFRMLHECAEDEEIIAIDVISLYPAMMKYGAYPLHNPVVLTHEEIARQSPLPWCSPEANKWRGFLHVRVLPPRHLRRPLLPYRTTSGELHFTLCALCSERQQQKRCRHAPHQRAWIAGYSSAELNKALSLGYRVEDVYEVWHWKEWASHETGNGLFGGFVNAHLKMKVEASGWPAHARTREEREAFLREYAEEEGIVLDGGNMEVNPACKSSAKGTLNSLGWR